MSGNVKFDKWVNDDNSENYKCRAWVNFNGVGTVSIRASGGVASITDNGTGDYTVTFTTAMPDANYSVMSGSRIQSGADDAGQSQSVNTSNGAVGVTTTSVRVASNYNRQTSQLSDITDSPMMCFAIFR